VRVFVCVCVCVCVRVRAQQVLSAGSVGHMQQHQREHGSGLVHTSWPCLKAACKMQGQHAEVRE
jgi:hypothetical protein